MGARDPGGRFGDLLRQLRERAGFTQEELAERAGLTTKGISALERGERRRPYPNTVRALAGALGLGDDDRARLFEAVPKRGRPQTAERTEPEPAPRSSLPVEATPLLGRDEEVEVLRGQLLDPDVRLMTIVGPGGVGKTRLATAVGRGLARESAFADGVWFVDLSTTREASSVAATIARALGAVDGATSASLGGLEAFVMDRHALVLLDNFEHVLAAAGDIGRLLAAGPRLRILITSREPLRLRWERTLPLAPLALPDPRHLPDLDRLAAVPAVALFLERARAAMPAFELTSANAWAVAELCVRLDGLPLAIELVAARAAQLGPATALDRLARRLPVPTSAMRDAPARQQSLRATLDWSLDLLEPAERSLFRAVAVFAGGWTVAAAQAVAGDAVSDVLAALTSLADKNLIVVKAAPEAPDAASGPRFRMLDTAREVAIELLRASGEEDAVRLRHANHYAELAEEAAPRLQGPGQAAAAAELEREEDNFRHALDWARRDERQAAREAGLRLVGALAWYWFLHGYPAEAREWFEVLLGPDAGAETPVEPTTAEGRALVLRAKALNAAGFRATDQGEYAVAATFHEQALATWRRLDDVDGLVNSLHGVGDTALWQGNADLAQGSYEQGRALAEARGTPEQVALFAFHLGQLWWLLGNLDVATSYGQEALAVGRAAGSTTWPPYALFVLASVAHERGEIGRAGTLYREAIALAWGHHDRLCLRMVLPGLAALATLEGDPVRALRLAGAASALEENAGIWAFPPIRQRHERWLAAAQQALDPKARAAAWEAGRALTVEAMVADALEDTAPAAGSRPRADGLSPREREVLELVAQGFSNRQIAETLFVTEHTAKYHVSSLFNKLGANSRAEAVTRAIARGLLEPARD